MGFNQDNLKPFGALPELMHVLQNRVSMELIRLLAQGPRCVSWLAETLELDLSAVSHCLATLRQCGIIEVMRDRKHRIYRLSTRVRVRQHSDKLMLAFECANGEEMLIHTAVLQVHR